MNIFNFLTGDLVQKTVRAVTILDEPYTYKDDLIYDPINKQCSVGIKCKYRPPPKAYPSNATAWKMSCCIGYVVELFQMILTDLDLEIDLYLVEDGKYGIENHANKTWDGMVGDLVNGKADLAVAAITITRARLRKIEFTLPWAEGYLGVLVKPSIWNINFLNFEFISPLGDDLQLMLWATVIGVMCVVCVMENVTAYYTSSQSKIVKVTCNTSNRTENVIDNTSSRAENVTPNFIHKIENTICNKGKQSKYIMHKRSHRTNDYYTNCKSRMEGCYSPYESMSYIGGVFLQRDLGGANPKKSGSRVASIIFAFSMVVVITTYTALLVEQGVRRDEKDPFLGTKDPRVSNLFII